MVEVNRLYLADCMDIMKDLPDKSIDLAIVDPPYGGVTKGGYMANGFGTGGNGKADHPEYNLALWDQPAPGPEYFKELERVSVNRIVWGGNYFTDSLPPSQCWVVWDKQKPDGVSYAECELAYTSFNRAAKMFRFTWNGMIQGDMANREKKIHPTQKPVRLYTWLLANFGEPGQLVLDTHVGSASSLIACESMGFRYIGCEIDPGYYSGAMERLEEYNAQIRMNL